MCKLLTDLHIFLPATHSLMCDNKSAISFSSNPVFHTRMKHLAIDYNFVRELVQSKDLQIAYISTIDQAADIFTKGLAGPRFELLRDKLRVLPRSSHISLRGTNNT